jgi:hypothetical protein
MENFTTLKDAQIVDVSGLVQTATDQNTALQKGDSLTSGTVLTLGQDSEITLAFEDGTEQRITGAPDETLAANDQISQQDSTLTPRQTSNGETPDNVQADIEAIQASIESGDDVDLPDTAAGGLTGNEGTDFVTLDRDGNELLAGAGYETAELNNPLATTEDPELFARDTQPTITQSDTNTVTEDNIANGNVLTNDSDADDDLTVESFTVAGDPALYTSGQTAIVENGNLLLNQDGSYSFTPAENFNGVLPVITYTTNTNATDTLSINVTPVSDLTDDSESVSTAEDSSIAGSLLANAASADGAPVVSDFTVNGTTFVVGETAELTEGDLSVDEDGSYSFVPADNFNGDVPVVTYTVSDGVNTDTSTLTINVTPVSDLTDDNETFNTTEDTGIIGNVLANAASADGTPVVSDFTVNGTTFAVGETAELTEGDLSINDDGSYSFIPADDFNGDVPVVTYTVSDGINTDTSTLTINVTPVSDLTDDNESVSAAEDTSITGNVLTNAASADGTPVVSDFTVNGTTFVVGETAELTEGDLSVNDDGSYSFIPADNFNGDVPVVTYTVSDGINTDTSTLTINVTPVSDLTDDNESVSAAEDTSITGNVLTNAASADGTPVVSDFTINGTTFAVGETAELIEGDLSVNDDGSYSFIPADNFNGDVPVVTYTVSDGINTDTSTLTLDITPVSDLSDGNEFETTPEDTTIIVNALANAASADGTPAVLDFTVGDTTFGIGDTATLDQGGLTLNADSTFTFVPADNYNGPVPDVTYTVSDGVNTETSTLTLVVTPVSDLSDGNESVSTDEYVSVSGNLLKNALNYDDTPVVTTFTVNGLPYEVVDGGTTVLLTEGELTISSNGDYTFKPVSGLGNQDVRFEGGVPEVTYTVLDGSKFVDSTLNIDVTSAPVANSDTSSVSFQLSDEGVISHGGIERGNVISRVTTGNKSDSGDADDLDKPTLTQIKFKDDVYKFDNINTSHEIETHYGTLVIDNKGDYYFEQRDVDIEKLPAEDVNLVFVYTIQDGDTVNPETAEANLTIEIKLPTSASGKIAQEPSAKSIDLDLDETSGTINTDFDAKALINVNEATFKFSPDLDDLSDILTDGHTGGLETYFAAMGEDESAMVDIDLAVALKDFQVDDSVVLQKGDANSEHASFTTVTNGFLSDGAIIISDTAEATNAPIAELDSQEFLS